MNKFLLSLTLTVALIVGLAGNVSGACLCGIVGLAASVPWSAYHQVNQRGAVFAFNPFLGVCGMRGLMDSDPEKNGGGIGEVLTAVKDLKNNQEKLLSNYDQLDGSTKKAMEELTALKNQQAGFESMLISLKNLRAKLATESRMAFGDPGLRIAADEEKRNLVLASVMKQLDANGRLSAKMRDTLGGIQKDLDTANTPGSTMTNLGALEAEIYDVLSSYGAFSTLDYRTFVGKSVKLPIKTARAAFGWGAEAGTISADSTKAGTSVTLTPKKDSCLLSISSELLEDDAVGVVRDVINDFQEGGAYALDWISFSANGDDDATDGGFSGLFEAGTQVTAASGNVSVATLDFDDFVKTVANAPAGILRRRCRWWIHPTILVKLLYIKDSNGRPIFNTAIESPSMGGIGTILGFPVTMVDAAPSTDSTSSKIAAFGDPMGFAVRVRRVLEIARSEHWAFDTDEISYRAILRAAAAIKRATAIQVLKTAAS